ncbi:MAG: S1C family serine protease [Kiritimatiellia bacterium]|nr:trypsin-like peptidase domain-containing protein [Lentisphaerota bacterium]
MSTLVSAYKRKKGWRRAGLLIWLGLALASQASMVTITLRGGGTITAPLLKQDLHITAIDLGYDVLAIPASAIIAIREHTPEQPSEETRAFYNAGIPGTFTTTEAAAMFAPAVCVVRTPRGMGSGFFINRQGYLITNFHVIRGERQASVTRFVRENEVLQRIVHRNVRIVALDAFHDLAVLRIDEDDSHDGIVPVMLAPDDKNTLGETVFVIGNPLGLERSVTQGVVSQTARNFNGLLFLQTDAPVNPGNSGGPLFNSRGQVIGVINMQIPVMQGLNFAIPIRHVRFLLNHLDDFAFDETNPESGFLYPAPPRRMQPVNPETSP